MVHLMCALQRFMFLQGRPHLLRILPQLSRPVQCWSRVAVPSASQQTPDRRFPPVESWPTSTTFGEFLRRSTTTHSSEQRDGEDASSSFPRAHFLVLPGFLFVIRNWGRGTPARAGRASGSTPGTCKNGPIQTLPCPADASGRAEASGMGSLGVFGGMHDGESGSGVKVCAVLIQPGVLCPTEPVNQRC